MRTIVTEDGPIRLIVEGRFTGLAILDQNEANDLIQQKFFQPRPDDTRPRLRTLRITIEEFER